MELVMVQWPFAAAGHHIRSVSMRPALFALALFACACGPTVGDPCTTAAECGGAVCLNRDFTPGGYCSTPCSTGAVVCPSGTVCVRDALGRNTPGCMLSCGSQAQCRDGYVCRRENNSATEICVGPQGI
jgi:hypothetical protein